MSDRLAELRRQRAAIEAHLAWLDREIAAESQKPAAPDRQPSHPDPAPTPTAPALTIATAAQANAVATTVSVVAPHVASLSPPGADSSVGAGATAQTSPAATRELLPDAIMDEYRVDPVLLRTSLRKGCLLYFALAFVVLSVGVTVFYFVLTKR